MAELVVCIRRTSSCCSTIRLWLPVEIDALALCREHEPSQDWTEAGDRRGSEWIAGHRDLLLLLDPLIILDGRSPAGIDPAASALP
jgi:hypothetical protein